MATPAADSADAPQALAADTYNYAAEVRAVVLSRVGSDPLNTAADIQAVVLALEQQGDPIDPTPFYADPSHDPSDHPSVAVRHDAIRKSTQEVECSNALECAK